MSERTRKLAITFCAVALFVGFIFLTRWTGDAAGSVAAMDDQETRSLSNYCSLFGSGYLPYETLLRGAAGLQGTSAGDGNGNGSDGGSGGLGGIVADNAGQLDFAREIL